MRVRITFLALGLLLVAAGCSRPGSAASTVSETTGPPQSPTMQCGSRLSSTLVGRLGLVDGSIVEDAVASPSRPGVLWVVGPDPSDRPELLAVSLDGELLATAPLGQWLESATDLSFGPGPEPDTGYLYVADLTDDRFDGTTLEVLRIREPELSDTSARLTADVVALSFAEEVGFLEAMMVDPDSGDLLVLTRKVGGVSLYRAVAPASASGSTTLRLEASLHPLVTSGLSDAAAGPDGNTFSLSGDSGVSLWLRPSNASVAATLVQSPCLGRLGDAGEEAVVAFKTAGTGFYSVGATSHRVFEHELPSNLATVQAGSADRGDLAPSVTIVQPSTPVAWKVGDMIAVEAGVTDDQAVDESAVEWELVVHRCPPDEPCAATTIATAQGSPAVVSPAGVGVLLPARIELRATYVDATELAGVASVDLQPRTSTLTLASSVPGAAMTVGGVPYETPLSTEAVVGDRLMLEVEALQSIEGAVYEFDGWSNSSERLQELEIGETDETVTLVVRPERGFVRFTGIPGSYAERRVTISTGTSVIDMRGWAALEDWSPESDQAILGANGNSLQLAVTRSGNLRGVVRMSSGTASQVTSTDEIDAMPGDRLWVRYVLDIPTGVGVFYTSTDRENDGLAVEWTQLGEPVETDVSGPIFGRIRTLVLGQGNLVEARPMIGKLFGATWLTDGRQIRRIDFSTTNQLTSTRPDYSRWGSYFLRGPDWEYFESAGS